VFGKKTFEGDTNTCGVPLPLKSYLKRTFDVPPVTGSAINQK
jgi:hypothetical protein